MDSATYVCWHSRKIRRCMVTMLAKMKVNGGLTAHSSCLGSQLPRVPILGAPHVMIACLVPSREDRRS